MSATMVPAVIPDMPSAFSKSSLRPAESGEPALFRRSRTWWLILAIVLISEGNGVGGEQVSPGHLFYTAHQFVPQSDSNFLVVTILTWTICLALMAKWIRPMLQMMMKQRAVLAFPVLALLSTLWSVYPSFTIRRAVLLFLSCALGWFLAVAYTPADQIRIFLAVGAMMGFASVPMAVLLPRYGLDFTGAWKGVFSQKNSLGFMMFLLFSGLPFCRIATLRKLVKLLLQALLPIALIILSQSKESLICVAILLGARIYGPFVNSKRRDQLPFVLCATGLGALGLAGGYNLILMLLQRDPSMSGRTHEWAVIVRYAYEHLWLGYGYQAFWNGTPESLQAIHIMKGTIHGSDNGYLDTLLQFGVLGLVLWAVLLLVSLRDIARALRTPALPLAGYWYIGLIISIFVLTAVGSAAMAPSNFVTTGLALACAGLRKSVSEEMEPRAKTVRHRRPLWHG